MIRRTASRRRRDALYLRRRAPSPAGRALRARLAARRPARPALAPLSAAELWILAILRGAAQADLLLGDIVLFTRRHGRGIPYGEISTAARDLVRRRLCRLRGHRHDRVALTDAGRVVAALEADHLAPAAATPWLATRAVEVWRCVRAQGAAAAAGGDR